MRSGSLRHEVILQQVTYTQDDYGGNIETWADTVTVRALIEPLRGQEYYDAQQVNAKLNTKILIRHWPGLVPHWRVVWNAGNVIYDIHEVLDIAGRTRSMQLLCSQVEPE